MARSRRSISSASMAPMTRSGTWRPWESMKTTVGIPGTEVDIQIRRILEGK
jgi:hypothetical protein